MVFLRRKHQQKPRQWGPISSVYAAFCHNAEQLGLDPSKFQFFFPMWEGAGKVPTDICQKTAVDTGVNGTTLPEWRGDKLHFNQAWHGGLCDGYRLRTGSFVEDNSTCLFGMKFTITGQAYSDASHYIVNAPASAYAASINVYYNVISWDAVVFKITDAGGWNQYARIGNAKTNEDYFLLGTAHQGREDIYGSLNGTAGTTGGNGMDTTGYESHLAIGYRGNYNPAKYYGFRGDMDLMFLSSQFLGSSAERDSIAGSLTDNPYQLLQPVPQKTYFISAGVSPIKCTLNYYQKLLQGAS